MVDARFMADFRAPGSSSSALGGRYIERYLRPDRRNMALSVAMAALVDRNNLRPVYQSVFDLASLEPVGAEALARWPTLGIVPDQAFKQAQREGRLSQLDEACRDAAIETALAHGLPEGFRLFVNLEPSTLVGGTTDRLVEATRGRVDLVVEITERAIVRAPR